MTDLLTRPSAPTRLLTTRSLSVSAALAGLAAPLAGMGLLWAAGLAGWYADGGTRGSTLSVLRVAVQGWLLGHGTSITLPQAVLTASPLGLTLLFGWLAHRLGRWAGRTGGAEDLRSVGLGTVVLAGVYAVTAFAAAFAVSVRGVDLGLAAACLGGATVGTLAGGTGLLRGAGLAGALVDRAPPWARAVGLAATASVLLPVAAGAVAVAAALAADLGTGARIAEQLGLDLTGGVLSLLLAAAIAPNLALLAGAYLLGPGFAVGTGTVVSPAATVLGPVPALPVLAALPDDGWAPGWAAGLLAVPVLLGLVAGLWAGRAVPTRSRRRGLLRGLAGGLLGAVALSLMISWAGGSIGSGRMSHLGAPFGEVLGAAVLALVPSAGVGGLAAAWWARRRGLAEAPAPVRPDPVTGRTGPGPESSAPAADRAGDPSGDPSRDPSRDLSGDLSGEPTIRVPWGRPPRA